LVSLAADSLDSRRLAELSTGQLAWLKETLRQNAALPTILFFHAPLGGTLEPYNKNINTPSFVAMPKEALAAVIDANPQICLWISGHTHTPPTNPSYASPVNVFRRHVTNIHNADMDRERIWTNSLYLYPDKIVVKTFDHQQKSWLDKIERTFFL
jgi:hypothetical protein